MKKILLILSLFTLASGFLPAQTLVSTVAENKKLILEEFSGVSCTNCPAGHATAAGILAANPGNTFVVGYHPTNSSLTSGTPNFRRAYADAFFTVPYCGSTSFMPGAFTNRRAFSLGKIQTRGNWDANGSTIMAEASPVNVGLEAIHDKTQDNLTINVEVYFTGTVSDATTLYVMLTENDIIGNQAGQGSSYVHKHVFREAFCGQWGDPISTSSTGDLHTFSFSLPAVSNTGYVMENCEVVAYVYNSVSEEVLSGNGADVVEGMVNTANGPEFASSIFGMQVAPNPFKGSTSVNYYLETTGNVEITLFDLMGKTVLSIPSEAGQRGKNTFLIDANRAGLSTGVYMLQLRNQGQTISRKVVLQ